MRSIILVALAGVFVVPAAFAQVAPTPPTTQPAEPLRCKRFVETGNLAKTTRVCHTRAEWDRLQRQGRAQTEAYQQPGAPPRLN